jgi:hypothetical protein
MNSTPQRPQQRRRQRHTTLSGEEANAATPKIHGAQSSGNLRPQQQAQRRTPQSQPRAAQAPNKLQRQHSVSCCTPTGKLTPPRFARLQKATNGSLGGSQTSLFAGSKFMDSPAPEMIPMPPSHWFAGSSPTPSSVSSFEDAKSVASVTSSEDSLNAYGSPAGFRLNPLQLIAAVSAVA